MCVWCPVCPVCPECLECPECPECLECAECLECPECLLWPAPPVWIQCIGKQRFILSPYIRASTLVSTCHLSLHNLLKIYGNTDILRIHGWLLVQPPRQGKHSAGFQQLESPSSSYLIACSLHMIHTIMCIRYEPDRMQSPMWNKVSGQNPYLQACSRTEYLSSQGQLTLNFWSLDALY